MYDVMDIVDVDSLESEMRNQMTSTAAAMHRTAEANQAMVNAKDQAETEKINALTYAYSAGHIDGKNKEARELGEKAYLEKNQAYQNAQKRLRKAENELAMAKADEEIAQRQMGAYHSIATIRAAQLNYLSAR